MNNDEPRNNHQKKLINRKISKIVQILEDFGVLHINSL
jgi:hypothetical protein